MDSARIAVRALANFWSLGAIGLLVLNDHVLKHLAPSPITGKLSDIAGLVFFPLLIAVGFGSVIRSPRVTLWVSVIFTSVWFAAINTLPEAARATERLVAPFWQWDITVDPTDLLALPALGLTAFIWSRTGDRPLETSEEPGLSGFELVVVIVGAAATMATSCVDPLGVQLIEQQGALLVAAENTTWGNRATSDDGGYTWTEWAASSDSDIDLTGEHTTEACLPDRPEHCFRIDRGSYVEETLDGGVTWQVAWQLPEGREEFVTRAPRGCGSYQVSAEDLFITDDSEPLVLVAMANDGLLRRLPDGTWERDVLGIAEPLAEFNTHITPEWFAALAAMLTGLLLFTIRAFQKLTPDPRDVMGGWPRAGMVLLGIAATSAWIRSLQGEGGFLAEFLDAGVILLAIAGLAGPLAVWSRLHSRQGQLARDHAVITLVTNLALGLVVIGPFLAWSGGLIARWDTAALMAGVFGFGVFAAGGRQLGLAPHPPEKTPVEDESGPIPSGVYRPPWSAAGAVILGAVAMLIGVASTAPWWGLLVPIGVVGVYLAARLSGYQGPAAMTAIAVAVTLLIAVTIGFLTPFGRYPVPLPAYALAGIALRPPNRLAIVGRLMMAIPVLAAAESIQYQLLGLILAPLAVIAADMIVVRLSGTTGGERSDEVTEENEL